MPALFTLRVFALHQHRRWILLVAAILTLARVGVDLSVRFIDSFSDACRESDGESYVYLLLDRRRHIWIAKYLGDYVGREV